MASRRRLDISSLLCDNEQPSVTSPDTQLSRPPPQSPVQHQQQQAQPSPAQVHSLSYNRQSPLATTFSAYDGPQHEQFRRQHQRDEQFSPAHHTSSRPLPPATVLTPLVLQPSPPRRRTPSPPYSLPSASPVEQGRPRRRGRHSDGFRESGFPRPGSFTMQAQSHPHPYSQLPQPPSFTSPANIHEPASARRASVQLTPRQYSSTVVTYPSQSTSPPLPITSSSSRRPLSISTTDLTSSARPSASNSSERHVQLSPVLPRQSEARMYPTQRASASLSPTVQTSGLSGLDVLVQAATEERERIDVHRRQSGGEESVPSSLNSTSAAGPPLLSTVESRSVKSLQVAPPTPPYTASPRAPGYLPVEPADTYYKEQGVGETGPAEKRRRSSPESLRLHQKGGFQASQNSPCAELPFSEGDLGYRTHSPGPAYIKHEQESHRSMLTSHHSSATARHSTALKHDPAYESPPSARPTANRAGLDALRGSASSRSSHPLSPAEPVLYARRSPPRSRPKPKKPGSAALAVMEKNFRDVALADTSKREFTGGPGENTARRSVSKSTSSQPQAPRNVHEFGSRPRQSNERGAADDEDVDDFFLSAFDSPRNAEKQISSHKSIPVPTSSDPNEEDAYPVDRQSYLISRRTDLTHSSLKSRSSSPERINQLSEPFSPFRRHSDHDDEDALLDVEAEILDELAVAAGAATSDDERTDFDGQETDNMEVDVENELLSLIDGPSEPSPRTHHHTKLPPAFTQSEAVTSQPNDSDWLSMPPPDSLKASSVQAKSSKKGSTKAKAKGKGDTTKSAKGLESSTLLDVSGAKKSTKSKTTSKPRPTKNITADKSKSSKLSKEPPAPDSGPLSMLSTSISNSNTPTEELFPMVTSSGRMVTKSKKSAAAAASVSTTATTQPPSSQHRKKTAASGGGDGSASRSRSHSVMPGAPADSEGHREKATKDEEEKVKDKDTAVDEANDGDNDKLYCICRTHYDEDRVMIACDRCDEWYHIQCVNMPELLIDLVDQFICSNCIALNPSLNLRTTYKQRCLAGLKHSDPDSADACHRPSRGAYSKYCSDECGVRYLHRKIQAWASNGGDVQGLWESVLDTKRREGYVMREPGRTLPKAIQAEIQNNAERKPPEGTQIVADEEVRNSLVMRLEEQLQTVVREREELKAELELLSWRERLLHLASERAESVGDCGWDQRLVYGDEDLLEFGAGVLESYEDGALNGHVEEDQGMDVDGQTVVGEWWCPGKKKCERHMGWQRVRAADMEKEQTSKERALGDLTTRERVIRSRIEDILHPQSRPTDPFPESTFKFNLANVSQEGGVKKAKRKTVAAA